MVVPLFCLMCQPDLSHALQDFVNVPQPAFGWKIASTGGLSTTYRMVSQTWQGKSWSHTLSLSIPPGGRPPHTCFLIVTGDKVGTYDAEFEHRLAKKACAYAATLYDVPNQPLFEKREDDLIAYTFEQYLETGDSNWPLLLPMANSVKKAMDALQQISHGAIERFVVTGASKRGWTTWLAAAMGDKRVVGVAPVAFDNLRFADQLRHQVESWGHLSEKLGPYANRDLPQEAETESGKNLIGLVDPFSYLARITCPVLIVRGSNDPYWTADATSLYWNDLEMPKGLVILPNEGHDFRDDRIFLNALAQFGNDVFHPSGLGLEAGSDGSMLHARYGGAVKAANLWFACSQTRDFSGAEWSCLRLQAGAEVRADPVAAAKSRNGYVAAYIQIERPGGATLCTPISLLPLSNPSH